jgi:hypothetical protein
LPIGGLAISPFVCFVSFVVQPPRAIVRPPLSVIFRVIPWLPPRAKPFANLASWRETPTRHPRPPHIARIDYDYEHRCAEHEHDPIPFP